MCKWSKFHRMSSDSSFEAWDIAHQASAQPELQNNHFDDYQMYWLLTILNFEHEFNWFVLSVTSVWQHFWSTCLWWWLTLLLDEGLKTELHSKDAQSAGTNCHYCNINKTHWGTFMWEAVKILWEYILIPYTLFSHTSYSQRWPISSGNSHKQWSLVLIICWLQ